MEIKLRGRVRVRYKRKVTGEGELNWMSIQSKIESQ